MSVKEQISKLKDLSGSSAAKQRILSLCDEGSFSEIGEFYKSRDGLCEAVCGFATVGGEGIYVFAQSPDVSDGAMSLAQAKKIKTVYDLAAKNGRPVVGIFDSKGVRIDDGADAMNAFSEVINSASLLSGVVPQIAVVAGACMGQSAVLCAQFDIVIMDKTAKLSLYPSSVYKKGEEIGTADFALKNGTAHIACDGLSACFEQVGAVLSVLPQNNLAPSKRLDGGTPTVCPVIKNELLDSEDKIHLADNFGETAETLLARIDGKPCGAVLTKQRKLDAASVKKISRFVRMCDAFSIPLVTIIDADGFSVCKDDEISNGAKLAAELSSVYCEATTAKISLIFGRACGGIYTALAAKGTSADIVLSTEKGVVSPLSPEAAAIVMFGERIKAGESIDALSKEYEEKFGSALYAAEKGYIDEIISESEIRVKLSAALDALDSKRESRPAKKHTDFPF